MRLLTTLSLYLQSLAREFQKKKYQVRMLVLKHTVIS